MQVWRLIKLATSNAFTNMAVDEAIFKAKIEKKVPNTLRFYQWKPSAVSIGRFQTLQKEVDLAKCKEQKIDIVRRISGGGSVYHDSEGEITYSIIAKLEDLGCKDLDLLSAYQKICNGLNDAIRILGTKAEYHQPNPKRCPNLTISGKKISGNAQTSKKGILLQHGTFMINLNHERMFTFLRVHWAKTLDEVVAVSKRKLTSAKQELNTTFSTQDVYQALIKGFEKALNIQLFEAELTNYEKKLVEKIKKGRFGTEEWTFLGKSSI